MASKSLKQFGIDMRGQAAKIPDRADQITRQIALAADRALVIGTPVDEGRARANWQPTIGAPATGTVAGGTGKGRSGTVAGPTAAAARVIASYKNGQTIFLTNNLPYIVPLNNGHSKQAPAGFVESAVASVENAARRAKLIT